MATSLPWRASSTTYSSAWSRRASSSSVLAGGGYSTCLAGTLPRALELMTGSATWPPQPSAQMPAIASIVTGSNSSCSGAKTPVGAPPPRPSLHLPPQHLLPLAPPRAVTPPTPVPHPSLELTRIVRLPGVHWPSTSQAQPLLHTSGCRALHNSGSSSSARHPGMA